MDARRRKSFPAGLVEPRAATGNRSGDSRPSDGFFLLHNRRLFGFDLKDLLDLARNFPGVFSQSGG